MGEIWNIILRILRFISWLVSNFKIVTRSSLEVERAATDFAKEIGDGSSTTERP